MADETILKRPGICPVCKKKNHSLADPTAEGDICDGCQSDFMEKASIVVCNNCKRIAAIIENGETPSGFVVEKGKYYHSPNCIKCNPFVSELKIIELEEAVKGRGVKE